MSPVPLALIAIFIALGGLHAYWAFGDWPGASRAELHAIVVGVRGQQMINWQSCFLVAGALLAAAALVYVRHRLTGGAAAALSLAGYATLIAVFAARGLAPYVSSVFDYARGTPFHGLNLVLYAPLCLLIAALLIADFPRPGAANASSIS